MHQGAAVGTPNLRDAYKSAAAAPAFHTVAALLGEPCVYHIVDLRGNTANLFGKLAALEVDRSVFALQKRIYKNFNSIAYLNFITPCRV